MLRTTNAHSRKLTLKKKKKKKRIVHSKSARTHQRQRLKTSHNQDATPTITGTTAENDCRKRAKITDRLHSEKKKKDKAGLVTVNPSP